MPGFNDVETSAILNTRLVDSELAYSSDGATESSIFARTAVVWGPAVNGDPSTKANLDAFTTAPAAGPGTLTHCAIFEAGIQITDWNPLTPTQTVAINDTITFDPGALVMRLS